MILNVVVAAAGLQLFRSVEARSDALWSGSGSGSGGGGVVGGFHCFASTATKKFPLSLTSRSFKRGWDANHDYRKSAKCSFVVGLAIQFFYPNHDYCVAETRYLADKAGPSAPDRDYSILGS